MKEEGAEGCIPAGGTGGWTVVDVREDPARWDALLRRFYDELMVPFFPPQELDELGVWRDCLRPEHGPESVFHVLLAVRPSDRGESGTDGREVIGGGLVFEYYGRSRCGFVSYVVVSPGHRKQRLAQRLLAEGVQCMHRDALAWHGRPPRSIFLVRPSRWWSMSGSDEEDMAIKGLLIFIFLTFLSFLCRRRIHPRRWPPTRT